MKILILKLSSLGDLVHTIPAVNFIKENLPEAKIDWLCYKSFAPILEGLDSVDEIITLENKKISTLIAAMKVIKANKYDYVIDFQGLIKTSALSFFSGAKVFGFSKPREQVAALLYNYRLDAPPTLESKRHVVLQNLDLAGYFVSSQQGNKSVIASEAKQSITTEDNCENGLLRHFVPRNDNACHPEEREARRKDLSNICIVPSTTWQSKLWLPEYWTELIHQLYSKYNSQIYILGTLSDMPNIEPIIAELRVPFHLVTDKKLQELPGFFLEMDLVIGVDTGPLHIAAHTLYPFRDKKKIIGIYGPTSGARSGPFGFEYLSYDEISGKKASNKKTLEADGGSMKFIEPSEVLSKFN